MNILTLNMQCLFVAERYENLNIHERKVRTPYFINHLEGHLTNIMKDAGVSTKKIEMVRNAYKSRKNPVNWYRGKGTPTQIESAAISVSESVGLPLTRSSSEVISEFMKLYGIGIDCSGYVYNILKSALFTTGEDSALDESLNWKQDSKKNVYNAGAFSFAGKASKLIKPSQIRETDLILLKNRKGIYNHISLILKRKRHLFTAQSTISNSPSGSRMDKLTIVNNMPTFSFKPEIGESWEKLYKNNRLEFRRLEMFKNLK